MNGIWLFLLAGGILCAAWQGRLDVVTTSAIHGAEQAVTLAFKLIGVMSLWLGLMKIVEVSGLAQKISHLLGPIVRVIFPRIPSGHPALTAIVMMLSANLLGLGNAVTPLGIKAMQELQTLNPNKKRATCEMCTLLALCTTGLTLVPATVIALRSAAGSKDADNITGVVLLVSLLATISALLLDRIFQWLTKDRGSKW